MKGYARPGKGSKGSDPMRKKIKTKIPKKFFKIFLLKKLQAKKIIRPGSFLFVESVPHVT